MNHSFEEHYTLKKLTQQTDNTTIYPLHLSKGT